MITRLPMRMRRRMGRTLATASAAASGGSSSLAERCASLEIKYLLVSFDDLFGVSRSKLVPASAAASVEEDGAGFAAFASHFDMTPADADMLAFPDPSTLVRLPWDRDIGWVACDLKISGREFPQGPRNRLRAACEALESKHGLVLKTGVECEFFLMNPDASALADPRDTAAKPCYDQQALIRQRSFICELNDAMAEMGFPPYQTDHEDANGQFECNWDFDHALLTADRHTLFKFTAKSLAEKHGLRATFMPKPFAHLTGNGCHVHLTLHDVETGGNKFKPESQGAEGDDATALLSPLGRHFVGGLLGHAAGLCAVTNPTVNSYKRLSAPVTTSGATWAPASVTWAGNNRSHMIRIPDAPRVELRLPDMSTNAYLLPTAILAAGIDGVERSADPGAPCQGTEPGSKEVSLPGNLLDALRALDGNPVLKHALGDEAADALIKLRVQQWHDYKAELTEWERRTTLDC